MVIIKDSTDSKQKLAAENAIINVKHSLEDKKYKVVQTTIAR